MTKEKKVFYKRWWFIAIAVIFGLGAIGSIVNPGGNQVSETDSTNVEPDSGGSESETFESFGCLGVSPELHQSIGLTLRDSSLPGNAAGFIAADYVDVKFVAVEFVPNGQSEKYVALFATNDDNLADTKNTGLIVAVDGFAKEFSGIGEALDLDVSITDRGAQEAIKCLTLPGSGLVSQTTGADSFDEAMFLKEAEERFGVVDETFDDGSVLTVMSLARSICEGDIALQKRNLGKDWDESFNLFAITSLCPEKLD